ncbi:CLUMA_CG020379, isoform A [Clunio marinus]|uniref:CLUMA_CG020379, isoform A n=1 Tax=Clunio marinus TaxID=568069 RepID=A0A1J1J7G0_9DIPT|nr:CLUMA_CG020379, isoform A [Clunio marinus]
MGSKSLLSAMCNETVDVSISTSSEKSNRTFNVEDEVEQKNLFPSAMYAHFCHSEIEFTDEDKQSKRLTQYYPQTHQFNVMNVARITPPSKTPFTLNSPLVFPSQQIYSGQHFSNLHEEYLNSEYRLNREVWTQEATVIEDSSLMPMTGFSSQEK